MCTLKKICTYIYTEGKLPVIPKFETFGPSEERMKVYSPEEEAALFSHLRPLHREFCTFLLYTGCRLSEARRVRWQDITDTAVTFWKTKTKKPRTVPLHPKAIAALEWVKQQEPNYLVWDIDYRELHYDWNRARDIVGLKNDPDAVIHALRHTCLSRLARGGMDILRIGTWAGHADIKTTKRYTHLMPSDLFVGVTLLDGTSANDVAGTEKVGVRLVASQDVA
jgi:integrase